MHQNECYCYPNNSELEANQSSSCVSEVIINTYFKTKNYNINYKYLSNAPITIRI